MKSGSLSLANYVDALQTRGQYAFSRKKALEALGFSENAFAKAAMRLTHQGRVQRVRGDFYIIVPLEYQTMGTLPASWFIDEFMRSLSAPYYVGILSAAALHGAAHQQPMVFQVVTNRFCAPIRIGRLRIEFHYKKLIEPFFCQPIKTETGTMQVATPEMTACDVVRYINAAGQIHNVATLLTELSEKIDIKILYDYVSKGWVEVSVVQRLGYLLEFLEYPQSLDDLSSWVKKCEPHYRLLVKGQTAPIIERNKKWFILVNEEVETDL